MPLAVITGGTSGIGFQLARRLRDRGYELFIQGLADEHLEKTKRWLERESKNSTHPLPKVNFFAIDLSHPKATQTLSEAAIQYADSINSTPEVLINSAGFGLYGAHTALCPTKVSDMLQVNVIALTQLCQTFAKDFAARGTGYILNIASTTAFQPLPFLAAYASAKAYVKQFSLALAEEVAQQGVRVCCACPGATNTPFLEETGLNKASSYRLGPLLHHLTMDPAAVADTALSGLFSGKRLITPGLVNKGHYRTIRHVPESLASALGKLLLRPKDH